LVFCGLRRPHLYSTHSQVIRKNDFYNKHHKPVMSRYIITRRILYLVSLPTSSSTSTFLVCPAWGVGAASAPRRGRERREADTFLVPPCDQPNVWSAAGSRPREYGVGVDHACVTYGHAARRASRLRLRVIAGTGVWGGLDAVADPTLRWTHGLRCWPPVACPPSRCSLEGGSRSRPAVFGGGVCCWRGDKGPDPTREG
jgi:hypothetical protein